MEYQGNVWAQHQRPDQTMPTIKREDSPDNSNDRASSESSYDPTSVMIEPMAVPTPSESRKRKPIEPNAKDRRCIKRARRLKEKRRAVSIDAANQLPAEVWHHIFTFLPPPTLGRLLLVNKLFNVYLDPASRVKAVPPHFPDPSSITTLRGRHPKTLYPLLPETIWRSSRRVFLLGMPTPLRTKSELDSWRLACSNACQFCNFRSQQRVNAPQMRGPGPNGVAPVFPLLMVTCGNCLAAKSVKEIDLLLSSAVPSVLLPALPAAYVTPEMHVTTTQGTKLYSREQIEELKAEFEGVKLLGSGAAEEWFKGLASKGKSLHLDSARWEKWENSGGLQRMRQLIAEAQRAFVPASVSNFQQPKALGPINGVKTESGSGVPVTSNPFLVKETKSSKRARVKRTRQEAMKLMEDRREEIRRRAVLLSPSLTPSVLARMPSFQAAVQISTPLDDDSWSVLAERLLDQKEEAQHKDHPLRDQACHDKEKRMPTAGDQKVAEVANGNLGQRKRKPRDPQDVPDAEWDDVQGPVRAKMSDYADEIIRDKWEDGDKVNKKACPSFAAEVLLYVRKRFYEGIAKEQSAAVAAQKPLVADPPEGPWLHKLTLENMKWVFDVKVKPFTGKLRPELFICHGCSHTKFFGLEGVIQHFAAKHTKNLSLGNVVVFWRAEWPETPPFMPDPRNPTPLVSQDQPAPQLDLNPPPTSARADLEAKPWREPTQYERPEPWARSALHVLGYPRVTPPHEPPTNQHGAYAPGKDTKVDFMVDIYHELYQPLYKVKEVDHSIAFCIMIHNIAKKWQTEFKEPAPLHVFQSCLWAIAQWPEVGLGNVGSRAYFGLACKACLMSQKTNEFGNGWTTLELANHFKQVHVDGRGSERGPHPLDWRTEMVELPGLADLRRKLSVFHPNQPWHNEDKLYQSAYSLIVDALPWAFGEPAGGDYSAQSAGTDYQHQDLGFHPPATGAYNNPVYGQPQFVQERAPAALPQQPQAPTSQAPQHGQHILDALESRLQESQHTQPPPAARAQTRPPEYHPNDPARSNWPPPPPGYYAPPHYEPPRQQDTLPFHHHHPQHAPQQSYGDAPQAQEGEYEILEARDPGTGALYHIRRRVQRDLYQQYNDRAQARPPVEDYRRAGTVAPPAQTEMEDYDPRYPGGQGFTTY